MRRLLLLTTAVAIAAGSITTDSFSRKPAPPTIASETPGQPLAQVVGNSARRSFTTFAEETTLVALWNFEDGSGGPDPQGWTIVDRSAQLGTFFHVDDFSGLGGGSFGRLTPIAGARSLWCGARPCASSEDVCGYLALPGYGDNWDQRFQSVDFNVTGNVTINFRIRYDSEATYDYTSVEYKAGAGTWTQLARFSGIGDSLITRTVPAGSHSGAVKFRFRFTSDEVYSDEDGSLNTDGASIVDNVTVSDAGGVVDFQDFEGEAFGALATSDGQWQASPVPAFGDYASLFAGSSVLQQDPNVTNTSHLWGFFNGSPDTYECGGHPEQPAVPLSYSVDGVPLYIHNEIRSPFISLLGISPLDPILLAFDVYRDLPLANLVFYEFRVRSQVAGTWRQWKSNDFVYYSALKDWFAFKYNITGLVEAGATDIQIAIGAEDLCSLWCGLYGDGTCHTNGPLIDNIRLLNLTDAFVVTSAAAAGAGTLADAITQSNATPGRDIIKFNIPGAGPFTVGNTGTKTFTGPVVIDGFTQPGSSPNTNPIDQACNAVLKIFVNGGVSLQGGGSTVRGIATRYVNLSSNGNRLEGSFVGTDVTGTVSLNSTGDGVQVTGSQNYVGGVVPAARNVVAGHTGNEVHLNGPTATLNVVRGNFIGTGKDGIDPLGDTGNLNGVTVRGDHNVIGGDVDQARNVIVTTEYGIQVSLSGGNVISGNYIGLTRTGAGVALPFITQNASIGLFNSNGNLVGGTLSAQRNVCANTGYGILLSNANNNTFFGNYVGTDASGTVPVATTNGFVATASNDNWIGGTGPGEGNLIANSWIDAIDLVSGTGNRILGNSIKNSGIHPYQVVVGLGIDLSPDGVTANDVGDVDTGANNLQNFPVLTSAVTGASNTTFSGSLSSTPGTDFRIEFFSNGNCTSSGYGEGQTFLGAADVATDGSGVGSINSTLPVAIAPGSVVTATATDPAGNTSEFSACVTAINTPNGSNVAVQPVDQTTGTTPVTLTFDQVSGGGTTTLTTGPAGPPLPGTFVGGNDVFYNISTTATFSGDIEVCITYDEGSLLVPEASLQLLHWDTQADPDAWVDITSSLDVGTNTLCGITDHLSPFAFGVGSMTPVDDAPIPPALALHQNAPNPFNPITTIFYDVPAGGAKVTIRIYDVSGRAIRTLVDGQYGPGTHRAIWDGRNASGESVASGVYFYRMVSGSFVEARRMMLLK